MNSEAGIWEDLEKLTNDKKKGGHGGFQSMDLMKPLLSAIIKMNFNVPTPIQRRSIPILLQNYDIVAMARTGSGKTAAYMIPVFNKLRCEHAKNVGIKSVILSPTRELALQIMHVGKKLAGLSAAAIQRSALGTNDASTTDAMSARTLEKGKRQQSYRGPLKIVCVVGGTSLDAQFVTMATNPDIVVASPGRLLHLIKETSMKLSSIQTLVMDEADKLFELGLQPQIVQLMQCMPDTSVQKCLFSATMPSILTEFANAGLHNPVTVRLDAEMKISDKLKIFTFLARSEEKIAALIFLLKQCIKVKTMDADEQLLTSSVISRNKKRKSQAKSNGKRGRDDEPAESSEDDEYGDIDEENSNDDESRKTKKSDCGPQALVFVESKQHVELMEKIMQAYAISHAAVHGQMDQEARRLGVIRFTKKRVSVMIVTDVAARGLDIPLLDNVVNYSFPFNPKLFIHRVGRVARAGRSGCAYSLMTQDDMPYYVDLMKFLNLPIQCSKPDQMYNFDNKKKDDLSYTPAKPLDIFGFQDDESGYYGRIPSQDVQREQNYLIKLKSTDQEVTNAFKVADNAHKKYERTKKKASSQSLREIHAKKRDNINQFQLEINAKNDDNTYVYKEQMANNNSNISKYDSLAMPSRFIDGSDYYHTPIHPMLLRTRVSREAIEADAAKMRLRTFKSSTEGGGVLDLLAGQTLFHVPQIITMRKEEKEEMEKNEDDDNNNGNEEEHTSEGIEGSKNCRKQSGSAVVTSVIPKIKKLSLAESLLQRAKVRKTQNVTAPAAPQSGLMNINGVTIQFGAFSTNPKLNSTLNDAYNKNKYVDKDFFLPDEQSHTMDDQHYTLRDATIDIAPESTEDSALQRSVYAWNKKKSRYTKMNVVDAKTLLRGMKNEAGKQINFKKDKLEMYSKWMKKTNMRIQDCGEEEDEGIVMRAVQLAKTGTVLPSEDGEEEGRLGMITTARETSSRPIPAVSRSAKFNPQDNKDRDAFGALRNKGVVNKSSRQVRKERLNQAKKTVGFSTEEKELLSSAQGPKLKIGRKLKKLPSMGTVRSFDDMVARKKKKEDQKKKEGKGKRRK